MEQKKIKSRKSVYPKIISLCGDRKIINACKKAGLPLHNPQGRWNGLGYERLPLVVSIINISSFRKLNKIIKLVNESSANTPKKSYSEKKEEWRKKLSRLSGISLEESREISEEKNEYLQDQISILEDRNADFPSRKREVIINKLRRSNPLRHITDRDHANNILWASKHHKETDYEEKLVEGRNLAKIGEIEYSEIKNYAREAIR